MWQVQVNDDQQAFARLVKRWEKPIQRLCAQVTGDTHLGEDLCQEAFIKVFTRRNLYRHKAKFSTWLWRIALNLCYSRTRKAQFRLDRQVEPAQEWNADSPDADPRASPDQHLLAQEQAALLQNALLQLPEPQRMTLILRHCEGRKLREVAKMLQIPETTAATRCAVALSKLTRILEKEFEP